MRSLRGAFFARFLGRIDCIARFQPPGTAALAIAQQQLTALQQRAERLHVRLELPDGPPPQPCPAQPGRPGRRARDPPPCHRHEMGPAGSLLLGGRVPERVRVDLRGDRPVFPAP